MKQNQKTTNRNQTTYQNHQQYSTRHHLHRSQNHQIKLRKHLRCKYHKQNNKKTSTIKTPTITITEPTQDVPYPTMELTIGEFPTLPPKGLDTQTNAQTTLKTGHLPCNSMNQLPAITSNQPVQTTFKRLLETASVSEDNPNTPASAREQQNAVIQVCRELHRCSFRDLQNSGMGKKRRIISKAMYIELGGL